METVKKRNNMIALFHFAKNKLKFHGFGEITDAPIWDELFIIDGELKTETGRVLMDEGELQEALATGIGIIEIDNNYDTWYTCFVDELDERELKEMMFPEQGFHYLDEELDEALIEFGFTELEVKLAREFDDLYELYNSHLCHYDYVDNNYEVVDFASETEENEFMKIDNKFYIKL
ncbi:MAG: hypothetical protein LBF04_00890 [Prevotellaceae bacterium]|jgi:hypothetical protein|nr:hypothetical protein [Prevotellaceae bacterium]